MGVQYKISDTNSKFLQPTGDGTIDVVNDYSWTLSPKSARTQVPYIELVEYQQTAGQLIASILYFARLLSNPNALNGLITAAKNPADVYQLKYIAEPTGFRYKMPYFNPKKFSRTTEFPFEDGQSPFASLVGLGKQAAGFGGKNANGILSLGGLFGRLPAFAEAAVGTIDKIIPGKLSLENPRAWDKTTEGAYTFTFDLANTGTIQDIQQNRDLCYILKYQQSPNRRFVITDPVCIYSVFSPDIVSMPAAFISNLEITNLGNTRLMNLGGIDRVVPDAYRITIGLNSLFIPSRNIEGLLDQGQGTVGITTPAQATTIINNNLPNSNTQQRQNLNNILNTATTLGR